MSYCQRQQFLRYARTLDLSMIQAFSKSIWWLAALEPLSHIFTFLPCPFFLVSKRPSSFANVAPRADVDAGNFVNDVALIYFLRTKFGSRQFLLECFRGLLVTCMSCFLSNLAGSFSLTAAGS